MLDDATQASNKDGELTNNQPAADMASLVFVTNEMVRGKQKLDELFIAILHLALLGRIIKDGIMINQEVK